MAKKPEKTPEQEEEDRIKALWKRKNITKSFEEFLAWYKKQKPRCCYCGITEPEIALLIDGGMINKRLSRRGRRLELERENPNAGYDDFSNLALACYWCNNAKTDTFTAAEFKQVGQVFKAIWQKRLEKR